MNPEHIFEHSRFDNFMKPSEDISTFLKVISNTGVNLQVNMLFHKNNFHDGKPEFVDVKFRGLDIVLLISSNLIAEEVHFGGHLNHEVHIRLENMKYQIFNIIPN